MMELVSTGGAERHAVAHAQIGDDATISVEARNQSAADPVADCDDVIPERLSQIERPSPS
jgi:hypothetical protein